MKLVLVVILSTCVAYSVGSDCDLFQRFKVKHQWSEAFGSGHHRLEFVVKVFVRLFRDHPETRALFTRVSGANPYSAEFKAHAERVLGGFDVITGLLDDDDALNAQLAHLKEQHASRNVKLQYMLWFGEELIGLISQEMGVKFDNDAWLDCHKFIGTAIIS